MSIKRDLLKCAHKNVNAYDYVRNDGLIDDMISHDDYARRRTVKSHLSGLRICLDCGSTQRYPLSDPIQSRESWLAPWIWRPQQ